MDLMGGKFTIDFKELH